MPPEGMSFLLMAAKTDGTASQAKRVALGSLGRIRFSRAPHLKFERLSSPRVASMGRAFAPMSRGDVGPPLAKERALAKETDAP